MNIFDVLKAKQIVRSVKEFQDWTKSKRTQIFYNSSEDQQAKLTRLVMIITGVNYKDLPQGAFILKKNDKAFDFTISRQWQEDIFLEKCKVEDITTDPYQKAATIVLVAPAESRTKDTEVQRILNWHNDYQPMFIGNWNDVLINEPNNNGRIYTERAVTRTLNTQVMPSHSHEATYTTVSTTPLTIQNIDMSALTAAASEVRPLTNEGQARWSAENNRMEFWANGQWTPVPNIINPLN